jgi:hypothetical protein
MLAFHLARFKVNATPPAGHPLCGGWIEPVRGVDDPLWLRGVVLIGGGPPVVLAALDWTGVLNDSHREWTERLADAARTTPDRVALHCVHQHNAPFIDRHGNDLLQKAEKSTPLYDPKFVESLMVESASALRRSLMEQQPATHVGYGEAGVREVASNRRVIGPDGKIRFTRNSATKDPLARAEPEGTIDPLLRSIGFFHEDRPLARLYYYTTHPMSYYGDGRVSSDFVGLARARREESEPGTLQLYFTGCAGNITAGKYNDGSHANRAVLAGRVHRAMVAAGDESDANLRPFDRIEWTTSAFSFRPREDLDHDRLAAVVADSGAATADRNRAAMACGWLARLESARPILLGRLDLPGVSSLHLPAESFVEYQLHAQAARAGRPLAVAAYGDGGPWYIPLERSFEEGGYEPSVALVSRATEPDYRAAIEGFVRATD